MSLKSQLKCLGHRLLQDYQLNRIYHQDLGDAPTPVEQQQPPGARISVIDSPKVIDDSPDQRIRDHAWYAGEHAIGYGIWEADQLVCMCWFWTPGREGFPERFADLGEHEAIMVDLLTSPARRGKGYALAIIRYAERDLARRGYRSLWTWVWHSNTPSVRVFTKAGWRYRYFLVEMKHAAMKRYLRFRLPAWGK